VSQSKSNKKNKPTKKPNRWWRRLLRVVGVIVLLVALLLFFIRSPWGQNIIKDRLISYVSDKTGTTIELDKLFITFEGNLQLERLYLEDKAGDTLVYSQQLEANLPLWETITGEAYGLDNLNWNGLKANIKRKDTISGFNFQFLIDAFASEEETTETPEPKEDQEFINLRLGEFHFSDFNISYIDKVTDIDSKFKIGQLYLKMNTTDLNNMGFETEELALENTDIKFHLTSSSTSGASEPDAVLPKLAFNQLHLKNVKTDIQTPDLSAKTNIVEFYTELPKIDLTNEEYVLNTVQLRNSEVFLNVNDNTTPEQTLDDSPFEWPKLQVKLPEVILENNKLTYTLNHAKPLKNQFNPNAVQLRNFNLNLENISLKHNAAELSINQFSVDAYSGFQLKKLTGNFSIDDEQILVEGLDLNLNKNRIAGFAELKYDDLQKFIDKPENARFNSEISTLNLSVKDLFKFQPELADNPYLKTFSEETLKGQFKASGVLSDLSIPDFKLKWGEYTEVSTSASIQNITDMDALRFDVPRYTITTRRADIHRFVDESELGVCLPHDLQLTGDLKGGIKAISTQSTLETSQGTVAVEGQLSFDNKIEYNSHLEVKKYRLNELLDDPQLGELSLALSSKGSGQNINTLEADVDLVVSTLDFNTYTYENLNLNGFIKDGKGKFVSDYKDDNLNYSLETLVELDSTKTIASLNLGLKGVDLNALGFLQRNIKTGFDLKVDFSKVGEIYKVNTGLQNGVMVYENKSYLVGDLDAAALVSKDTTDVYFKNKILNLSLKANTAPQEFSQSLSRHIKSYLYADVPTTDSISKPVEVQIRGKLSQSRMLNEVLLVNVKDLDTIDFLMDYSEKNRTLTTQLTAPYINYAGNALDSLKFAMQTNKEKFNFDFGFKNIKAGPLDIPQTVITGVKEDEHLNLKFTASRGGEMLYFLKSKLAKANDKLQFSIDRDRLVLNGEKWQVSKNNKAILKSDSLVFNNFYFNKDNQSVMVSNAIDGISKSHLGFKFENFKLSKILNYLNPETKLVQGELNGHFIIEEPLTNRGIVANIDISRLKVLKAYLGQLNLNGRSVDANAYEFDASIKEGNTDLDLSGSYTASEHNPKLNVDIDLNEIKTKALENLSMGTISEAQGGLNGNFNLQNSNGSIVYNGQVNFDKAEFKINQLNTTFMLQNETLNVDNEGLRLDEFNIRDANNNLLSISGGMNTESFVNPEFNLSFKAKDFKILEATKEDNPSFYGKAVVDLEGTLKGDLQIPDLDAKLNIGPETDFIYVLPPSTANIERRDGVVSFVNRENPDQILTKTQTKSGAITGFDINSFLKVSEKANFTIILDKDSGDNFQVQGKADLNFQMFTNGRINLSGMFEATSGQYRLSLYNLVKRKFLLAPGSRVTWNGDPFNAKLDVRAIYNVEASAYSLMSPQVSGLDPSVKSKYRQVLPFEVYLNIDGELLQPEISFELDMPEDERGAISGQVYSRVKQVNQQEAELSQQVFSLLVLNRFYPSSGNDGSSGGIQTLAQQNINDAISDQLNAFSDKILGKSGFELDFGLDSYTDYQGEGPTQRTQLNVAAQKKLFNDRLTVRVGSEIDVDDNRAPGDSTPVSGNVSLIYELTKDGRYRLKGFRRDRFENIIDGQTVVSGIALIFTKEFNKFDELWTAILKSSENDESENTKKNLDDKPEETNPETEN